MQRTISIAVLAVAALMLSTGALANGGEHGSQGQHQSDQHKGDQKSGHQHKGHHARFTFDVVTTDGGSCGVAWATDTLKRTYTVSKNRDGSFKLVRFDRGTFVTIGTTSPGKCDTTGRHGSTVTPGVKGFVAGYLVGTITGGTFDPNATCTGTTCGERQTFITTHFGPSAVYSCDVTSTDCKFNFHYVSRDPSLLYHHWQDKGKGAGTLGTEEFHGDIATA
jgi:hypothetical protein